MPSHPPRTAQASRPARSNHGGEDQDDAMSDAALATASTVTSSSAAPRPTRLPLHLYVLQLRASGNAEEAAQHDRVEGAELTSKLDLSESAWSRGGQEGLVRESRFQRQGLLAGSHQAHHDGRGEPLSQHRQPQPHHHTANTSADTYSHKEPVKDKVFVWLGRENIRCSSVAGLAVRQYPPGDRPSRSPTRS